MTLLLLLKIFRRKPVVNDSQSECYGTLCGPVLPLDFVWVLHNTSIVMYANIYT